MSLTLDHVFVFCDAAEAGPDGPLRRRLSAIGLVPSYSRRHDGQGTANVCYAFDNAYVELLYVADRAELAAPEIARTGLGARAAWRESGASPFGIALRGGPLPFRAWDYRFDGLPPGLSIPVAFESADVRQPFIFGSPGTSRPDRWTDGRAGSRQVAARLTEIVGVEIGMPSGVQPASSLLALVEAGIVTIVGSDRPRMALRFARSAGGGIASLTLPVGDWS
jgi:hypothetical protein